MSDGAAFTSLRIAVEWRHRECALTREQNPGTPGCRC